ncbi:hypothetical protein MUJ63_07325 [Lachnospiraceae bacterium NSJ-143]|nr:hypothetical protein [Lachnospiraceae bacterium NSJ-143]
MGAVCRLKSNKGFSLVEAVCAVVIAAAAVMLAVGVFNLYSAKSARGTDALTLKTAQNLASVNVNTTGSIFQEPDAADTFPLKGYFDNVSNSIVRKKPSGYNRSSAVSADGNMYSGAPDTLVIEITYDGENISYCWTEDH